MFGLDKLVGGAFKAIGLEELAPFASLAVNLFTGNYLGAAQSLAEVVGKFTGNEFLQNLSKMNPLGAFGGGAGGFDLGSLGNIFGGGRFSDILNLAGNIFGGGSGNIGGNDAIGGLFETIGGFVNDKQAVSNGISFAQTSGFFRF